MIILPVLYLTLLASIGATRAALLPYETGHTSEIQSQSRSLMEEPALVKRTDKKPFSYLELLLGPTPDPQPSPGLASRPYRHLLPPEDTHHSQGTHQQTHKQAAQGMSHNHAYSHGPFQYHASHDQPLTNMASRSHDLYNQRNGQAFSNDYDSYHQSHGQSSSGPHHANNQPGSQGIPWDYGSYLHPYGHGTLRIGHPHHQSHVQAPSEVYGLQGHPFTQGASFIDWLNQSRARRGTYGTSQSQLSEQRYCPYEAIGLPNH